MRHMMALFCALVSSTAIFGEPINLTGTVKNQNGNPITGAVVALPGRNITATTNSQGSFTLSGGTSALPQASQIPSFEKIAMHNGTLSIGLTRPTTLIIDMFDMRGHRIGRILDRTFSEGEYRFELLNHPLASNITLIRVTAGNRVSAFRFVPLENGKRTVTSPAAPRSPDAAHALAKIHAGTIDTLRVAAPGYFSKGVPISSYEESVTVTLDTLNLPLFSFFVTSLASIQELSQSPDGFGGDLRFGKTGQGAGLLGADSICQCIAEMSMPGSKVKKWRAYLSAVQGPDGKQVNAIDRIGQGPWYDRIGLLVAQKPSDLLESRPASADSAIINDLPNEFGVPNHRPDPNQPAVDNHLTVTGTGSDGKLFFGPDPSSGFIDEEKEATTCDDWTSTTTVDGPRAGLSWPRSFGFGGGGEFGGGGLFKSERTAFGGGGMMDMDSWVSSWTLPGCEAGIDLDESTMAGLPGVKTIGSGGGYGGFYCFALNP